MRFIKYADFHQFLFRPGKIIRRLAAVTILMPPTFHIAHLKRYVHKFSEVPQKLTCCERFGLQLLLNTEYIFVTPERRSEGLFLDEMNFSGETIDFRLKHAIHIPKAMHLRLKMKCLGAILVYPVRRQNFAGKMHLRHLRLCHKRKQKRKKGKLTWIHIYCVGALYFLESFDNSLHLLFRKGQWKDKDHWQW